MERDFSKIGEVKTMSRAPDADDIPNQLLKEGWLLLDVRVVEHRQLVAEGLVQSGPGVVWVFGRRKTTAEG